MARHSNLAILHTLNAQIDTIEQCIEEQIALKYYGIRDQMTFPTGRLFG